MQTLVHIPNKQKALVMTAVMLAMFLAALDQTIVSTALPIIAQECNALEHLSWVITAYMPLGLMAMAGALFNATLQQHQGDIALAVSNMFFVGTFFMIGAFFICLLLPRVSIHEEENLGEVP